MHGFVNWEAWYFSEGSCGQDPRPVSYLSLICALNVFGQVCKLPRPRSQTKGKNTTSGWQSGCSS